MITLKPNPTLANLQAFVEAHCQERGWNARTAIEKMLFLTEEVGEVAKAVRLQHGIAGVKPDNTDNLGEELVDVFNFLLDIATEYDIDLETAFRAKWQRTATRVWPGDTPPKV
jgi:NTP pyrophosphatase (non-canonical NTP hydrolase)